ncbi:hypothetical protein Q7P37_000735 [Cladosporium fusiforme]
MSDPPKSIPTINPDDHGAKVILCGALLISPVIMMSAIGIYNRIRAKTLLQVDSVLSLLGTILALVTYATFVHAKNLGFGRHTSVFDDSQLDAIRNTILSAIIMFFISQAFTTSAYNVMTKKTARSQRFIRNIEAFSGVIAVWALANAIVIAVSLAQEASPPVRMRPSLQFRSRSARLTESKYVFFIVSAVASMCITAVQLAAFMWIVWNTSARMPVKIRWSLSLGLFVPALTASIIMRLIITPTNLFTGDWTFTLVPTTLLFLIELFLSVMNLLAPSLPIFFDQTSTGGLYFRPDDNPRTTPYSSSAQRSRTDGSKSATRTKNTADNFTKDEENLIELRKVKHRFSASVSGVPEQGRTSFDSDAILVRRSVEVS